MRISVITVCFNAAATLTDAVQSVLSQVLSPEAPFDLEYIVVDGGSTDGTLDILAPFRDRIATLISEPDHGLYDAMNKGIRAATGDVVAILNADDVYASNDVLARVAEPSIPLGRCGLRRPELRCGRRPVSRHSALARRRLFAWRLPSRLDAPHPALFVRRTATRVGACSTSPFARPPITSSCFGSSTGMA